MKVIVRRNWENASNAWIDVQTYTGLKLPPPEIQYKLSFMDKNSVPAQMIVTSDGASWVDGLGGGYKGKTVLDMTIEEPQRGAGSEEEGGGGCSDVQGVDVKSTVPEKMIIVSGAGSPEVNGNYYLNGEKNGYPEYTLENSIYDNAAIFYDSDVWILAVERYQPQMFLYYLSTSSAESPELVDGWEVAPFGTAVAPAPTVIAQGTDTPVEAGKALLTDGAGKASWESIGLPYKSYVAVISQSGNTDAPPYITREIHNSLGLTEITFHYADIGRYTMETPEGWNHSKAIAFYSPLISGSPNMKFIQFILGEYGLENYIYLRSSLSNESFIDGFSGFYLEIRVYD